jgi:transcriptional regulator
VESDHNRIDEAKKQGAFTSRLSEVLYLIPNGGEFVGRGNGSILCTSTYPAVICRSRRGLTMGEKSDLPQGTLDLLILKVVALGDVHGYAISQRLEQVSRYVVRVPQGSLYPALHRLENRGLLAADWKATETGREAKFYRLTRKGRSALDAEIASWRRLAEAVGLILEMERGGAA